MFQLQCSDEEIVKVVFVTCDISIVYALDNGYGMI